MRTSSKLHHIDISSNSSPLSEGSSISRSRTTPSQWPQPACRAPHSNVLEGTDAA